MKKINKILACIDFSEYSVMTLEYALEIARATRSEIVVFNVINQRDLSGLEMANMYFPEKFSMDDYIKDMKKDRLARLKQLVKAHFLEDKLRMIISVDTGAPFDCILNAVTSHKADLVVMANKGRGSVSRVLFGSAAEKVFRHCPVPVLSVRDIAKFKREK
ncbi:MAG: universal stress protein [Proteobacteria bacterium]|nr:universal stress protein [Pseudomonadota bacterium]MBU1386647.1 universal stress protein [Pseudomonadota bacterium]MBU1543258.1 universal stress protein [Pseudomonadota bacterium]MBU2482170.1 universal stress protein [Pseudomonadota bacterium]